MKLSEIAKKLDLKIKTENTNPSIEVEHGYASDLLSDVMANSIEGSLWITLQIHPNIVAVASMKELSGIILVNGREPEGETLKRANQEKVNILVSKNPAFEVAGKLYALGIKGITK